MLNFLFSGAFQTMKIVISQPELRDLALCAFSLGGLQSVFAGFFILFMIDGLNYSELEAGSAFASKLNRHRRPNSMGLAGKHLFVGEGRYVWHKFFCCCRWSA